MPRLIYVRGARTPAPLISFRGSLFSDTINTRTYSTTIDLGEEHASRLIVVGTACVTGTEEEPTACTVDGASATKAVGVSFFGAPSLPVQLWYVARPTGGSVTVAFSKPGGVDMDRGSLAVWSVYFLQSQTPIGSNTDQANPADVSLTVPGSAVAFGVGAASSGSNITWTLTGLTSDATDGTPQFQSAFGSAGPLSAGSRTIQLATSLSVPKACSAYWR